MKNITSKQEKIIKALLKLNKSIEDLKKLSSIEYTEFFKVLVLNDKIDLYKDLTTAENLKLLGLSMADIEKVNAEIKTKQEDNAKKARAAKEANKNKEN
jgi:ABC-type Na+ transport system ATPase subunit NatA